MAGPSKACMNLIFSVVPTEDWTNKTDLEILNYVNSLTVPNPVSQGTVFPPLNVTTILGLMETSLAKLATLPTVVAVRDDIRNQDRNGVANWAVLYHAAGLITAEEKTAVLTHLTTQIPDPTWSANIPWDTTVVGRRVDLDDIKETRKLLTER